MDKNSSIPHSTSSEEEKLNTSKSVVLPGPFRPRLLIVEDDVLTSMVMARLLARSGYGVQVANCAAEALDVVKKADIDIVISDINLPDGDGVRLMHSIRGCCHAIGIAVTGYDDDADWPRFKDAGFVERLTKPLDFRKLQELLERLSQSPPTYRIAQESD